MPLITPLRSYDFRLDLMGNKAFAASVQSFSLNVIQKQVHVDVRETFDCQIMPLVISLSECEHTCLAWEGLDLKGKTVSRIFFLGLQLIAHDFMQSYIDERPAEHVLRFSYKDAKTD